MSPAEDPGFEVEVTDGLVRVYGVWRGERVRLIRLFVGSRVVGVPVERGPCVLVRGGGVPDVSVDSVVVRDVVQDNGETETAVLLLAEGDRDEAWEEILGAAAGGMVEIRRDADGISVTPCRFEAQA